MSRRPFSYVEPHYCRVLLVKDAPVVSTDPLGGPERLAAMVRAHTQDLPGEAVYSIVLDARRRPLTVVQVSVGTLTQSLAHPRTSNAQRRIRIIAKTLRSFWSPFWNCW